MRQLLKPNRDVALVKEAAPQLPQPPRVADREPVVADSEPVVADGEPVMDSAN